MTDNQYMEFRKKGLKIYKIFIDKNKIKHEEVDIRKFDEKWIYRNWLNSAIPYNTERKDYFMYVTEDRLKEMKEYFVNYFIKEENRKIKEAQKKINKLSKIKY